MDIYRNKIRILTLTGEYISLDEWQHRYGIDGQQIGKYFYYTEPKFRQDIEDFDKLIVCEPLIMVMDKYRFLKKEPVTVNSFNRSTAKQLRLHKDGFKAAKISPHVEKMGADLDTVDVLDTVASVGLMRQAGNESHILVRIGYQQYLNAKQTFIHVDVCPMYFAPGAIWHHRPHPLAWETENEW